MWFLMDLEESFQHSMYTQEGKALLTDKKELSIQCCHNDSRSSTNTSPGYFVISQGAKGFVQYVWGITFVCGLYRKGEKEAFKRIEDGKDRYFSKLFKFCHGTCSILALHGERNITSGIRSSSP